MSEKAAGRYTEILTYDWQFLRGDAVGVAEGGAAYAAWKTVRVPHDYAIEGPFDPIHDKGNTMVNADGTPVNNHNSGRTGALPLAGTAWYRRALAIRPVWQGKRISLEFDGDKGFFVNGRSYGIREKKPGSSNLLERYRLIWQDVAYEPGELTVNALDKNGNVLKTETIRTAGAPAGLALSLDRESYRADDDDLCYVTVKVLDKDGNFCPKADVRLYFSCEGCGEYVAADNGDQTDLEIFSTPTRKTFSGMAVGIFRTLRDKPGEICIHVSADGMEEATVIAVVK